MAHFSCVPESGFTILNVTDLTEADRLLEIGKKGGNEREPEGSDDGNQTSHFIVSFNLLPTATFSFLIGTSLGFAHFSKKFRCHKSFYFLHILPLLSSCLKMKMNV